MRFPRIRRAFTLIELLAVIAIVALLAGIVIGLRPENPKGLQGATQQVMSQLSLARQMATLSNIDDPTDDRRTNKYATVRTRLLILNDPSDSENHLRLMGIVYGAQRIPAGSTVAALTEAQITGNPAALWWYADSEPTKLPEGIYYVENKLPKLREILTSDARSITFGNAPTMRLAYPRRNPQQENGPDARTWYYYEFLADGTCNMRDTQSATDALGTTGTGARLMFVQAELPPGASQPDPKNPGVVGGVIITPRGKLLPITGLYEQKQN